MDQNRKARLAVIGAAILFLIETGLQVSGLTNLPLAIALWGLAALLFLYWLGHSLNDWRAAHGRKRIVVDSSQIILGCLGGAVVLLLVAAFAFYNQPKDALAKPGTEIAQPGLHKEEFIKNAVVVNGFGDNKPP